MAGAAACARADAEARRNIAGAARHGEGIHVELVGRDAGNLDAGIAQLADWLAERRGDVNRIVLAGRAGSTALQDALIERRVPRRLIHTATFADYTTACAMFYDGLLGGSVTHLASEGQQTLDDSVAVCDKEIRSRDGAWGWKAMTPDGDDTPIEAASLAHWAAKTTKRSGRSRAVFA